MFKKYLKTVFRHFIIWTFAFGFWTLMREFGQEVSNGVQNPTLSQYMGIHLILGLCAGFLFGSLEFVYEKHIYREMGFGKAILLGMLGYVFVVFVIIILAILFFWKIIDEEIGLDEYKTLILTEQLLLLVVYFLIVGTLINLFREIDTKFGRGNLWKMFKGEFYSPKEEEKIFMFLDLKSSTKIAEALGHIKYSKMLQDCFKDLAIVEKYDAEIYQYVGDEAVLVWDFKKGLENQNGFRTFFGFKDTLNGRRTYYETTYGLFPEFKAGLHMGKIVTAEVGVHKREIAYHGDTINTAARIQEKCRILDKEFLISEEAKNSFETSNVFKYHDEGEISLKGKVNEVRIFSVYQVAF